MATKQANIKGVVFNDGWLGSEHGSIVFITYDLVATAYTGGTDTLQLGGAGTDEGVTTTLTLAQIVQNRRRDGKTVTIYAAMPGPVTGSQAAATNGPELWAQSVAASGGNVTLNLFSAPTAGSAATTTTAAWDRAGSVALYCKIA